MNPEKEEVPSDQINEELSLQELLGIAVRSEIEAADTYRNLVNRKLGKETKNKIERLVKQEEEHEKMFLSIFEDFFPDEKVNLPDKAEIENSAKISREASVEEIFVKAMQNERKSEKFYSDLRKKFEDKEIRRLLGFMAANEREHYEILKTELEKIKN